MKIEGTYHILLAYFLGLCKGIFPQIMAIYNFYGTVAPLQDPEIPIEYVPSEKYDFISDGEKNPIEKHRKTFRKPPKTWRADFLHLCCTKHSKQRCKTV